MELLALEHCNQISVADLQDSPPCYEFILFVFLGRYKQILIMCLFKCVI